MTIPKPMACVIVQPKIINAVAKGEKSAISCCLCIILFWILWAKRTSHECGGTSSGGGDDDVVRKPQCRIMG